MRLSSGNCGRGGLIISVFVVLLSAGCSKKTTQHIGGPYYFQRTEHPSLMAESGGGNLEFELQFKKDGKTTVISKMPFSLWAPFEYHVYGSNLVFIEGGSSKPRLMVFSEKKGNTTIDEDVQNPPWKITADDTGVTCRYFENGVLKGKPAAKFYSAEFLKNQ